MARTVLKITGADTDHFLQGLITNDLEQMGEGLLYAAILTPQGKYLADFLLHRQGAAVFLDVDSALAPGLMQRLTMYKLRAEVTIEETDLKMQRGTGARPAGALDDPRHPALGWRLYGTETGEENTDWIALRVRHCIPETGIELTPDTYILEAGFERLNGVDFRKGCFVGQEVVARMKHKTTLRKGLVTVGIEGTAPVGTDITADGKAAGIVYTQSEGQAIAYLRFDRANAGPLKAGDAVIHYDVPA